MRCVALVLLLVCSPALAKPIVKPTPKKQLGTQKGGSPRKSENWTKADDHYFQATARWTRALGVAFKLASHVPDDAAINDSNANDVLEFLSTLSLVSKGAQAEHKNLSVPSEFQQADKMIVNALSSFVTYSDRFTVNSADSRKGIALASKNFGMAVEMIGAIRQQKLHLPKGTL